jgi:phosphoserine phosphatase
VDEERDGWTKWVVTIIARVSVERALGRVIEIVKEQGLELDYFRALSHVMPGGLIETPPEVGDYSCAEVWLYGFQLEEGRDREAAMREEYAELADEAGVDIAFRREEEYEREWRLFCFDMDSTLIQGETIDELAKMAGVGEDVAAVTAAAMRGEIEFQESFRRRVGLLKGLPEARVLEVVERIPMMHGAERLFRTLKARGMKTAIFSGGFTFFAAVLKERLGVDYVFANQLDVRDGVVTGEVPGRIVDGARKAELISEVSVLEGIPLEQVVAVGDGANDLPMLRLAGMGVAFHAKPVVRAEARFSVTHAGLDGLLYLLGVPDEEWV